MGLCGSFRCGCGIDTDGSISISGSGEPGDPYVLSVSTDSAFSNLLREPSGGDDTAAIQASLNDNISTALGPGVWRADGLVIPPGHKLTGLSGSGMAYDASALTSIRARVGATSEWVVEFDGTPLPAAADSAGSVLSHLAIHGNSLCKGVLVDGLRQTVSDVSIHMTSEEGFVVTAGACLIEFVIVTDTFNAGAPVALTGSAVIGGADHVIRDCEFSGLPPGFGGDYFGGFWNGLYVTAGNSSFDTVIGEFADAGIYIANTGLFNKWSNCRADKNWGHGFFLHTASYNAFSGCGAHDNSKDAADTYDQFHVYNSTWNTFASCHVFSSEAVDARYGFYDNTAGGAFQNEYAACTAPDGWTTAAFGGAGFDPRPVDASDLTADSLVLPAAVGEKIDYYDGTGYSTSVEAFNLVDDIPSGSKRSLRINGTETFRADDDGINIVSGDVRVQDTTFGLILRAPGGTYYRVTVNDSGVLVVTAV
jgi:hypothetical protein